MYLLLCLGSKVALNSVTSGSPQSSAQYPGHSDLQRLPCSSFVLETNSEAFRLPRPRRVPFIYPLSRKKNFGISYLGRDRLGQEAYLSLLSDWDLSTAFATASKPYLQLRVDIRPSEDSEYPMPATEF